MEEFTNLINHCKQMYEDTPFCDTCPMTQCYKGCRNDCYNCLTHIHKIYTKNEHYTCEKITYNYILKHAHRYASEISWAVWNSRSLFNLEQPLKVASVGCGPSTELYGFMRAFYKTPVHYSGFDMSEVWKPIQDFIKETVTNSNRHINYHNQDFIEHLTETSEIYDLLIFNYFFSDFIKYKPEECMAFIENLVPYIFAGHFKTIIINDVMLMYESGTGFSCMEKIAGKIKDNMNYHFEMKRRHFAYPNQWQFAYGDKLKDDITLDITEDIANYEPFSTCGSIQLIINTINKSI